MQGSNGIHWRWIVCSTFGLVIGLPAGLALGGPIEVVLGAMFVAPLALAAGGAILGSSQWLVLRRSFSRAGWWILLTALGLGAGATAGVVLVEFIGRVLTGSQVNIGSVGSVARVASLALIGACAGIALGSSQWLFLRTRCRIVAKRWLLLSFSGMTLGFLSAGVVAELLPGGLMSALGAGFFLIVASLVAASITARGLSAVGRAPQGS